MAILLRTLLATFLLVAPSMIQASPMEPPRANEGLDFLTAGAPGRLVAFDARTKENWLAFTASAGESVSVGIAASTIDEACGVSLEVLDDRGHVIAREACAGAHGAAAALSVPRAGTYRLHFSLQGDASGRLEVTLASPSEQRPVPAACQVKALALNKVVGGAWDTSCESVSFAGHFAQYYTIAVPAGQVISISLSSTTNDYLVLHDGSTANGTTIATDDDSGPGTDALIVKTLAAGTYTIEATTAAAGQQGNFTVAARTNKAPCFAELLLDQPASGSWSTSCESQRFADTYAKYYTITVPIDEVVTLSLGADHIDTYLVLRYGDTQLGTILAEDDNSGPIRNSLIVIDLQAGTYTLEATTVLPGQLGDFTISARSDTKPCFFNLALDKLTKGKWSDTCGSVFANDHYAQFYAFTVPSPQIVTLSLSSTTNPLLVLRLGSSPIGSVIATDDNSGAGSDSRIVMSLPTGSYTLEATTAKVREAGSFKIAARTNIAPCFTAGSLNGEFDDALTTDCTSTTVDDRYSKYYVVAVPTTQSLTILLTSTFDNYLVLRGGPDMQLGPILAQDDNSGGGTNARIAMTLPPGVYTVEATSAGALQQGSFTLKFGP
jgi:hypothetical protein